MNQETAAPAPAGAATMPVAVSSRPRFSLVVPIYNEAENVAALLDEIAEVLGPEAPFEALLVNDGSTDDSRERMAAWKAEHDAGWLRIVDLERNSGQSAAVLAGARAARSEVVVTMDGDMQNDPRDLLRILDLLRRGAHVGVVGVRAERQDSFVRRVSSRIGNVVRNWITGDRVTDAACGIKGFRRQVFLEAPPFHGMHRFMATLARFQGEEVVEIVVNHRPRRAGTAKYGIGNRALRGLMDCFAIRWLRQRAIQPRITGEG